MQHQAQTDTSGSGSMRAPDVLRGLVEAGELANGLGVTRDTLTRMAKNETLGFPKPFKLGPATYYNLSAVRRWVAEKAGLDVDE